MKDVIVQEDILIQAVRYFAESQELREYCKLACRSSLSEQEAERLAEILELAELDALLNFWISESDYLIAHELNLLDEAGIYQYRNQQARLREYLDTQLAARETGASSSLAEELRLQIKTCLRQLQKSLKDKGFDPGPVDGVFGPRTQAAIRKFQRAKNLVVDGIAGPKTLSVLSRF